MAIIDVKCPRCEKEQVRKYGKTKSGKQRYMCINNDCETKIFLLEYSYNACKPGVKEQIVKMAINANDVGGMARILKVSPTTVINVLKKPNQNTQLQTKD